MAELLDARGVAIEPGDTAIYGFGGGDSVAMAEAVVLGAKTAHAAVERADGQPWPEPTPRVSLTPEGRVRLRIVRRSGIHGGTKPVVDVAPDRLVVLKANPELFIDAFLPPSPLPTQAQQLVLDVQASIDRAEENLRATEVPEHWKTRYGEDLAAFHAMWENGLDADRKALKRLEEME